MVEQFLRHDAAIKEFSLRFPNPTTGSTERLLEVIESRNVHEFNFYESKRVVGQKVRKAKARCKRFYPG